MRFYFGGKDDKKWEVALDRVVSEFGKLFPGYAPVTSSPFSNCVTFNYYDKNQ
jgi:hypothetical protein